MSNPKKAAALLVFFLPLILTLIILTTCSFLLWELPVGLNWWLIIRGSSALGFFLSVAFILTTDENGN